MRSSESTIRENEHRKSSADTTPLGVAVGINSWSYSFALACAKLGPAVLAGNPVIMKPLLFTSYICLELSELPQDFFPPGVVQALSGDDRLSPWFKEPSYSGEISYTEFTVIGKKVIGEAGTTKRVVLELGGNDSVIICADIADRKDY